MREPTEQGRGARLWMPLVCVLALAGPLPVLAQQARGQGDASLEQVYQAAHGGHLDQALQMMEPVLRDHPDSAKAHYVEAELLAQQGRLGSARTELTTAERLAPGLPFVKGDALQHLHRVLDEQPAAARRGPLTMPAAEAGSGHPLAWGLLLAVAFGALLGWSLTRANRARPSPVEGPSMPWPRADAQPQAAPVAPMSSVAPTSPMSAPPWVAPGAGASGPGWGSQVAAGVAGGLAAGAAAVAGQELGRRLFGHETPTVVQPGGWDNARVSAPSVQPAPAADDWNAADFGVSDPGSWDDDAADRGGLGGNWDV
jgi:hypothetical protein